MERREVGYVGVVVKKNSTYAGVGKRLEWRGGAICGMGW
jgi:hypothetical protein